VYQWLKNPEPTKILSESRTSIRSSKRCHEKMKNRSFAEIGFKHLGVYSAFQLTATLPTAFTVTQPGRSFLEDPFWKIL
jgi:hypothetical protein